MIKNIIVAALFLLMSAMISCGTALAFEDRALKGYDNPMDTRDEYDKKAYEPRMIGNKDLSDASGNNLVEEDMPNNEGSSNELR